MNEEYMVMDRESIGTKTAESEIYYNAYLRIVFFQGGGPLHAIVSWKNWASERNRHQFVPWGDIDFMNELGRGKRKRVKTDRYKSVPLESTTGKRKRANGSLEFDSNTNEIVDRMSGDDEKNRAEVDIEMKKVSGYIMKEYKAYTKN